MNDTKYFQIEKSLPHRYPFLLIDRVLEIEPGKRVVGLKNLTVNDYFFSFPGVLDTTIPQIMMIEGLAQTAALVSCNVYGNESQPNPVVGFLVGLDNFIFTKNPKPGDKLYFHVELSHQYSKLRKFNAWVMIKNKEAARGELTVALP